MEIEFTEFTGKAPRLEAVQVTAENVEALAAWMGADSYTIDKTLVGGERKVVFNKIYYREGSAHPDRKETLAYSRIGDWLIRVPEQVLIENARLYDRGERFYSYTQEEIDLFVAQQRERGEVDINKE